MIASCWKYVLILAIFLTLASWHVVGASTAPAPGTGVSIPNGTWTLVTTAGIPASTNNWEQLVYVHSLQQSVMLSIFHQTDSEPNESLVGYNFDTNAWDILDMGGLFHTENMPEGGESVGFLGYNPNNNTLIYHCCVSGSNQAENLNHTWWYDLAGQSGRDKQVPAEPPYMDLQPGGAFDVAHNVFVMFGGSSNIGTWIYDPVGNTWQAMLTGGTPPDPSYILPGVAYDSNNQQIYLFGGKDGSTYSSNLYTYSYATNTWTLLSPVDGVTPPGRYRTNLAYDSTNNVFLLYGGQNGTAVFGDTWIYDPVANTWTQLNPAQSPTLGTAADFVRLDYDSDHNAFVLAHKGSGAYFGGAWKTLPLQTWLFRYAGTGPNAGTLLNTTQPVSGSMNSNAASWAKDPALAASGNSLYVSWSESGSPFDLTNGAWLHIFASQYSNGSWSALGSTYSAISGGGLEAHAPSLTVVGTTPWISWYQPTSGSTTNGQLWASYWSGSSWSASMLGIVGGSTDTQGRAQLGSIAGVPYEGFIEVNKSYYPQSDFVYLKSWNGTAWSLVGSGPLNHNSGTGSTATSVAIAGDGTYPYAAWTEYLRTFTSKGDSATPGQVYVSHWNGTQWIAVGGSLNIVGTDWATDVSIAYFGGQPYAAWTERTQTGNAQLYVATWNGTTWTMVGPGPLNQGGSNGWAFHPSLVTDSTGTNLYVAWVEQIALGGKAQVFVAQLSGGSWTVLGGPLNADPVQGSAQRVSLGILNGQPVVAWGEVDMTGLRQVYVAQWSGSTWTMLPGPGPAKDTAAPSTPTGLIGTATSTTQVNLSWAGSTDVVGVTGYFIFRNGAQIASVTSSLTYQDTGLSPSTTYTYTVVAYDAAGNVSAKSSSVSVMTLGNGGPVVSITAPTNGATVSGTITISANATAGLGMSSVQFQIDGTNLGGAVGGPGPTYSTSWNTTTFSNGTHTITAIATDTGGNTASTSMPVTVNNAVGLVISSVAAGSVTSSGATITWTTNFPATSQVAYGTTSSYGSTSTFDPTLVTSHSVALSGLSSSTTYHYQVLSQDSQGDMGASSDATFTTSAPGLQTWLQLMGNSSEVSGTQNGATVTPSTTPTGFTGTVIATGTGSVNFTPGTNGVYFLNCCKNTNSAYFKFVGSTVGSIFNVNQGQVSFALQSRYSYAQRQATAAAPRYTFDVRDTNTTHQFSFLTQVLHGLQFNYVVGGQNYVYYVPTGTEDALFGNGVVLQVTLSWSSSGVNLYFNGGLVKSSTYKIPTPNWSNTSVFDFGAYEYSTFGGFNTSDDAISNFTVTAP